MAEKAKKKNIFVRMKNYFKELASEMRKITWPAPKQILKNSLIVLAVVIVSSLILFGIDTLFSAGLGGIGTLLQNLFKS